MCLFHSSLCPDSAGRTLLSRSSILSRLCSDLKRLSIFRRLIDLIVWRFRTHEIYPFSCLAQQSVALTHALLVHTYYTYRDGFTADLSRRLLGNCLGRGDSCVTGITAISHAWNVGGCDLSTPEILFDDRILVSRGGSNNIYFPIFVKRSRETAKIDSRIMILSNLNARARISLVA